VIQAITRADLFWGRTTIAAWDVHSYRMRCVNPQRALGGNPGRDREFSLTMLAEDLFWCQLKILVSIVFCQEWWGCGYSFGWCIQRYEPGYYAQEIQSKTLSKMMM